MAWQPKVPLNVGSRARSGRATLCVWDGTPGRMVLHPRRPGFWSVVADGSVAESAQKRRLSDTTAEPVMWHRLEFNTVREATDYADQRKRDGYGSYLGDVDRWVTRLVIEDPDFFHRYPMTRPLRILSVDIEQRTDGTGFPPTEAPMVAIALGFDEREAAVTVAAKKDDGEPDDFPCVAAWVEAIEQFDPDIIVGFNVGYDLGVLKARCEAAGYSFDNWSRTDENGDRGYSAVRYDPYERTTKFYLDGRIVWDLRKNANPISDYNLSGVKDLKLKTIAEFLGWPVIKEDTKNTLALWRDREADLVSYNRNDVALVWRMVERYLPDRIRMAEFFGAALEMTTDVGSGWAGTIAAARILFAEGIVSDGSNLDRHRDYIKTEAELAAILGGKVEAESDESDDEEPEPVVEGVGGKKIKFVKPRGAHVKLHQRGLFVPIFKVDFASFYPYVNIAVGCGPDNTRIVGTEPFGDFTVTKTGDTLLLSIPDSNYRHNWKIEVRGRSVFCEIVEARMKERLEAKYSGDETRATVLKTLLNSLTFGVQGALGNKYGVLPLLIIATGLPRELIREVERVVKDAAVETDTDGVYLSRSVSLPLVVGAANRRASQLGFRPIFKMDLDEYPAGWFHEAKQYLLLDKKGRVKRFGTAFKGSRHPAVFDIIVTRVGKALLTEGREAALAEARRSLDLTAYRREDFVQRKKMSQPPEAYVNDASEVKLARLYERLFGVPPTVGRAYEYVLTRDGMQPPTDKALSQIDEWAYLSKVILPALKRLGFDDLKELGIEERAKFAQAVSKRPAKESSLSRFM